MGIRTPSTGFAGWIFINNLFEDREGDGLGGLRKTGLDRFRE